MLPLIAADLFIQILASSILIHILFSLAVLNNRIRCRFLVLDLLDDGEQGLNAGDGLLESQHADDEGRGALPVVVLVVDPNDQVRVAQDGRRVHRELVVRDLQRVEGRDYLVAAGDTRVGYQVTAKRQVYLSRLRIFLIHLPRGVIIQHRRIFTQIFLLLILLRLLTSEVVKYLTEKTSGFLFIIRAQVQRLAHLRLRLGL